MQLICQDSLGTNVYKETALCPQVRGNTLASMQPDTPLCFGILPGKDGTWNTSDKQVRKQIKTINHS